MIVLYQYNNLQLFHFIILPHSKCIVLYCITAHTCIFKFNWKVYLHVYKRLHVEQIYNTETPSHHDPVFLSPLLVLIEPSDLWASSPTHSQPGLQLFLVMGRKNLIWSLMLYWMKSTPVFLNPDFQRLKEIRGFLWK